MPLPEGLGRLSNSGHGLVGGFHGALFLDQAGPARGVFRGTPGGEPLWLGTGVRHDQRRGPGGILGR